jgi:hypothetical protein
VSSHEDVQLHVIRDRDVGRDPDVAAEVVRRIVAESERQGEQLPARNDHRVIGLFLAKTQLTVLARVFGPTQEIRKMNAKAARSYWGAFARAALAAAGG